MSSSDTIIGHANPHTIKKFELIEKYVEAWAHKLLQNQYCSGLVFIDCMSNSGEYVDDNGKQVFGTPVRVAKYLRNVMEQGAAPWKKRLAALRTLHDAGCKTWVSIEPFPTPNIVGQDLQVLLEEVSFVDRIIFGRMNYSTEVTAYTQHKQFFNDRAAEVIAFCNERGISYHIKDGTITE